MSTIFFTPPLLVEDCWEKLWLYSVKYSFDGKYKPTPQNHKKGLTRPKVFIYRLTFERA